MLDKVLASPPDKGALAGGDARGNTLTDAAFAAAAPPLGLSTTSLSGCDQKGQTLPALAQAHNVSVDTLKTTMLSAARAAADAQVHSGPGRKAEADENLSGGQPDDHRQDVRHWLPIAAATGRSAPKKSEPGKPEGFSRFAFAYLVSPMRISGA